MSQTKVEAPFVENNRPFRNILINGDMSMAQRGTSFASVGNTDSQYTLDRWKFTEEGDFGAAEITITQDTDVPTGEGFAKSLKCVCATADTSIDSGTISYIEQRIEGQNLQHVAKGTSGAKKMTYSFFCKSNLTGTFTIAFFDQDNTRSFTTSYSLASANTWERIVINIPADTTGAFTNDNDTSFIIQMNLQAGTDKSNGALATAFEATAQGDRAVGQTNFFSSTDNNWYITGCQLEVGDAATDFEHLPFDVNLRRCQRYCEVICDTRSVGTGTFSSGDADESLGTMGACHGTRYAYMSFRFSTMKRSTAPTLLVSNDTDHFIMYNVLTNDKFSTMTASGVNSSTAMETYFDTGATSNLTNGAAGFCRSYTAAAKILVIDEL